MQVVTVKIQMQINTLLCFNVVWDMDMWLCEEWVIHISYIIFSIILYYCR